MDNKNELQKPINKHSKKHSHHAGMQPHFIKIFSHQQAGLRWGVRIVLMTTQEIEILRLCAWCKDLPLSFSRYIPSDVISLLVQISCLRLSRCGESYRVTPLGYTLLEDAGYHYEPDRQYRGKGAVLTRRLYSSEIVLLFYRMGADVFLDTPTPPTGRNFSFLPSFALRRKEGANVLGGTRLIGFLYALESVFIPYYIAPDNDGLYPYVEERTFTANGLIHGRQPVVVYTGCTDLSELIAASERSRYRKSKSTTATYAEAARLFQCPVCLIPLSEDGVRQLRIISHPGYREILIKKLLGKEYMPVLNTQWDARHRKTMESYLIGIDCDITRFERAIAGGHARTHILVLSSQLAAIGQRLQGKNAILHPVDIDVVESAIGLPSNLPAPVLSPFQTTKGGYINAPLIQPNPKARGKSRGMVPKT